MAWRPSLSASLLSLSGAMGACIQGLEPPPVTGMVEITSGLTFTFGRSEPCENEFTNTQVSCSIDSYAYPLTEPEILLTLEPFAFDVHEVTNAQYELCVQQGECTEPQFHNAQAVEQQSYYGEEAWLDYPVVQVTWEQANTYCEAQGKRLPTQYEWERVARGNPESGTDRRWPSEGMADDQGASRCTDLDIATSYCRSGDIKLVSVDEKGGDVVQENGGEIRPLFGNVSEWVAEPWKKDQLLTCKSELPDGCFWCRGCSEEDTLCKSNCKTCEPCGLPDAATRDPDITCHVGCPGESRQHPVCVMWETGTPLTPSDMETKGSSRAVRGGSVLTKEDATCQSRTDSRGQGRDPNDIQPHIGFRCARSL